MKHPAPQRRAVLGLAAASLLGGFGALPAHALHAPTGAVLLTVGGAIANANGNGAASFDLTLLQKLPQSSFSTRTPWYPTPRKFSGVLLRDLLAGVGAPPGVTIRAVALNDYRVDIPAEEAVRHGALLAYLLDDKPVPVREKGPLMLVYPFDAKPELRTALQYSRAIWQLRRLDLK
ncbi:MAG: molybdopterin-dependent oxidoreductase [Pseudomonadota bacterium]